MGVTGLAGHRWLGVALGVCVSLWAGPALADSTGERISRLLILGQGLQEVTNPDELPDGLQIQRRSYGVVAHDGLEGMLNALLAELQATLPGDAPAARVYVTPDPSFQARATADGLIFIAAGMLESIQSRDELAALIAHEYAHVVRGHGGRTVLTETARISQGLGQIYLADRYRDVDTSNAGFGSDPVRRALIHGVAVQTMHTGLIPGRSRREETDADLMALDLMLAAGYSPVGMLDMLDRMGVWEAQQAEVRKAQVAQAVDVGQMMQAHFAEGNVEGAIGAAIGGTISNLFTAGGNAINRGLTRLSRRHVTPDQRLRAVRRHLDDNHPDAERADPRPVPWEGNAEVAALFTGLATTHRFMDAVTASDRDAWLPLYDQVSSSPAAQTAYARFALMHVFESRVGRRGSVQAMDAELVRDDSLFQAHLLALELIQGMASADEQVKSLQLSQASLGDPPELLPLAVTIYLRAGETQRAVAAAMRCRGFGDPNLAYSCEKALKPG